MKGIVFDAVRDRRFGRRRSSACAFFDALTKNSTISWHFAFAEWLDHAGAGNGGAGCWDIGSGDRRLG
jgi:hypothetical protein